MAGARSIHIGGPILDMSFLDGQFRSRRADKGAHHPRWVNAEEVSSAAWEENISLWRLTARMLRAPDSLRDALPMAGIHIHADSVAPSAWMSIPADSDARDPSSDGRMSLMKAVYDSELVDRVTQTGWLVPGELLQRIASSCGTVHEFTGLFFHDIERVGIVPVPVCRNSASFSLRVFAPTLRVVRLEIKLADLYAGLVAGLVACPRLEELYLSVPPPPDEVQADETPGPSARLDAMCEAAKKLTGLRVLVVEGLLWGTQSRAITCALLEASAGSLEAVYLSEDGRNATGRCVAGIEDVFHSLVECVNLRTFRFNAYEDVSSSGFAPQRVLESKLPVLMYALHVMPRLERVTLIVQWTSRMIDVVSTALAQVGTFRAMRTFTLARVATGTEVFNQRILQEAMQMRRTRQHCVLLPDMPTRAVLYAVGPVPSRWHWGVLQIVYLMCCMPKVRAAPKRITPDSSDLHPFAGFLLKLCGVGPMRRVLRHMRINAPRVAGQKAAPPPVRARRQVSAGPEPSIPPLIRQIMAYL